MSVTFLDFIRKVHEERKARGFIIKGGKGSGWFAPPKGTHRKESASGDRKRATRVTVTATVPLHGKNIRLSKMGMVPPEELPPPPKGHIRLYHTTNSTATLPEIEREGLLSSKATGYEAPKGALWATNAPDAYSKNRALVVLNVPINRAEKVNVTDYMVQGNIPSKGIVATYPMVSYSKQAKVEARRWDHLIDTRRKFGLERVLQIVPEDVGNLFKQIP